MSHSERVPRAARVMRWVARIWGALITVAALIMVFTPDPYATEPISLRDGFLLSLWGVAILGLLLAWRWEVVGGIVTIATMVVRELAWVVLYGDWLVNFLLMWVVVVPPGSCSWCPGGWREEGCTGKGAPHTDEGGAGGGRYGGGAASRVPGWTVLGLDPPADRFRAEYPPYRTERVIEHWKAG